MTPFHTKQYLFSTFNNATYSWTPAPATGPKAVITTSGSPLGAGSDQTLTNYPLTLDGTQSTAGLNMVPPYQTCPITAYNWRITLVGGTIVTARTPTVALTAAQVGMTPGTITATLTVTAPSPTNTPCTNIHRNWHHNIYSSSSSINVPT